MMPYTGISTLFERLVANTQLTTANYSDASGKHHRVRATLNRAYYGYESETANSFVVGSYGKDTEITPPSDIDILFILPATIYYRYIARTGNIQSQLLQEVKGVLQQRFLTTKMRADGQIISIPFSTYAVELLPTFLSSSGQYLHADANDGGRWRTTDPKAEKDTLVASNRDSAGKTIHLIKLAKAWKNYRNVQIKSLVLELVATQFINSWQFRNTSGYSYYDFMIRDFFPFLLQYKNYNLYIPGTNDIVFAGDAWVAQATFASNAAQRATGLGENDKLESAKAEWRNIFGSYVYP